MQIGALGDIHGAFDTVQDIMSAASGRAALGVRSATSRATRASISRRVAPALLDQGQQRGLRRHRRALDGGRRCRRRCTICPTAARITVGPWRVAALGGTFAPSWYHTPAAALPPSRGRRSAGAALKLGKSRDDKRRHFVRDEVLVCKALTDIDLFLTHEAPRPFYPAGRRIDAGKTALNDVLASMRPRLHLFGHHHEFTDSIRQGVRSIGLDVVTKSYLLIDAETFKCERLDT